MEIVYICKKPLHIHSTRTDLASAMAETEHNIYFIAPLHWKKYVLHELGALTYDANLDRLNYRPYVRLTQKLKRYDEHRVMRILSKQGLLAKNAFIISDDMEICHMLKDLVPSNIRVVYHIIDRYSEYGQRTEAEKLRFDQRENEIIQKCDIILCISRKLLLETRSLNKNSFWFPSAVRANQIVKIGKSGASNKIGMISNNLSRINWSLLCNIAQRLRKCTIELIGKDDLPAGFEYPENIRIIGRISFENIKQYVSEWRVGLAIYEKSRFNEYCCPLKYFEYSSFNIPTVSTTIPEGKVWADLYPETIFLADEAEGIACYIEDMAEGDHSPDYTRMAKENTWNTRAEQLCNILKRYCDKSGQGYKTGGTEIE